MTADQRAGLADLTRLDEEMRAPAEGDEPACWVDGGDLEQLAKLGMGGVLGWADNGDDPRRVPLYTRQASGSARSEIETALLRSVEDLLAYAEDVLSNKEQLACFKPGVVQAHVKAAHAAIEAATSQPQPKGMPTNALAGAVCSVAEARGFVAFGAGVYRIQETQEPGLVVTFRRDGEQHYGIGDLAPEVDLTPIPADDIIVRLQFTSAAGLDSLEHHLRSIRAQHWPETVQAPAPAPDMRDAYVGAREDLLEWKRRALEAEELNRKFIADINGQTFMGEPASQAPAVAHQPLPEDHKRALVVGWFAEDWAIEKALGMLGDYDHLLFKPPVQGSEQ